MRGPRPWRPVVHPWMLRPPAETRSLADQLDGHLMRLDAAVAAVQEACAAANVRVAPAAGGGATDLRHVHEEWPVERLRAAVVAARDAFADLAHSLDGHSAPLHCALAELDAVDPRHLGEIRRLRGVVREHTDALSTADVACRRALEDAVRLVPHTVAVNAEGGWIAALRGVHGADVRAGAAGRDDLEALAVNEAHRRVRLCPDLARACAADTDPRTVPELAAAAAVSSSLQRVGAVRDAFAALHPQRARQLAVLYPGVVGALDGAPLDLRCLANRTLLRVELDRARRGDVELESRSIARRLVDESRWWRRARAALTDAWLKRDAITSFVAVDSDRPLLVRADLRVRIRLYSSLLYDRVDHGDGVLRERQLVLFDPDGRGRIAELWGRPGPATRHVAVVVPGTGTAVRGFHLPTDVAARLRQAAAERGRDGAEECAGVDGQGSTTVVEAWMGGDFPYAIGNQSVRTRYARRVAVPLRDHVEALRLALRPAAGPVGAASEDPVITVIGHSYGGVMVGAAELVGLRADRVLHLASPGAGPGVRSVADYPVVDPLGRPRSPQRFEMTAPGDPIRVVQWMSPTWNATARATRRLTQLGQAMRGLIAHRTRAGRRGTPAPSSTPTSAPPSVAALPDAAAALLTGRGGGLGIAPSRLDGVVHLDAGVWEEAVGEHAAGSRLEGPAAHAALTASGTTAFRRVVEVVTAPTARTERGA